MEAQKIIALDITHIKKDIVEIKERMEVVEKRGESNKAKIEEHDKKIEVGFQKITELENDVKELKKVVEPENIELIKSDLKKVAPIIKNIWWKFALLLVAFLILVFIIVSYLLSNKHIALMKSNNAKMENKEYYEKPNTRGSHVIQFTKAQQDSIDAIKIKKQIEETDKVIQESMKQNQ
jgi:ABC-type multidrug transport system fused ATPase/permease subunit